MFGRFISIITCVLMLLGCLSSCSMAFDAPSNVDYSDYEIRGVVVDADTEAIVKGVSLTLLEAIEAEDDVQMGYRLDSLEVSPSGTFEFFGRSYKGNPKYKYIRVTDQDPEIFGNYQTRVFKVELSLLDNISVYASGIYGALNLFLDIEKVPSE